MSFYEFPHTRTYDTDIGWLIKHCKTMEEAINALNKWVEEYQPKIKEMYDLYLEVLKGNLPAAISEAIQRWCVEHIVDLVGGLVKCVFFGLENGYFVAYIPESWDDITFKTSGWDIVLSDVPEYGHLILTY